MSKLLALPNIVIVSLTAIVFISIQYFIIF